MVNKELQLLVATKNNEKVAELKNLLSNFPVRLRSLREFVDAGDVKETGENFKENAALKAQGYALHTGLWSLADDSGLEVEALRGAPGIFSARYGGKSATDQVKIKKLLRELNKKQNDERFARFVCAMAISDEKGEIKFVAEGICNGRISLEPRGNNGFGYDPIFIPAGFNETFGELSSEIKQQISHRAQASKKIIQYLRDFYAL
ncbi:MAG: RdgB/HAM1 family non-canonical purine NTP pyrophosphatase [Pyrinomonadaceae bacterium]